MKNSKLFLFAFRLYGLRIIYFIFLGKNSEIGNSSKITITITFKFPIPYYKY